MKCHDTLFRTGRNFYGIAFGWLFGLTGLLLFITPTPAQERDHLTDEENTLIREAANEDQKMRVFVKAVDRRLLALSNGSETEEDKAKYGKLAVGSKLELMRDVERILDEAMKSLDEASERQRTDRFFLSGGRFLADACRRFLPKLKKLEAAATESNEKRSLQNAIEYCENIIDSSNKLPSIEKERGFDRLPG